MKNSNLVLRAQRLMPEVYSDESRDFQLFTKLMDSVYNSCWYNTETIKYVSDARNIDDSLLTLLADKFGIDWSDAEQLTDEEVRYLVRCLPQLLRNKGSLIAIQGLVNMYMKIYHIYGTVDISIANKSVVVQDITLSERTIILGLETVTSSTKMLYIMAKYLLPPGYSFFVYFYSKTEKKTTVNLDENITLLYRSSNLGNIIDQELPDFISNATYSWKEEFPSTRSARAAQFISAVDLQQLSSIVSKNDRTMFLGFVDQSQLKTISDTFADSYNDSSKYIYNPTKRYNNLSLAIFPDNKRYVYTYEQLFKNTHTKEDFKSKLYSWHLLDEGSLIIANTTSTQSDYVSTGDIHYFSINKSSEGEVSGEWNKLTFLNSFKIKNNADYPNRRALLPASGGNWNYCCIMTNDIPFLYKTSEPRDILLTQLPAKNDLPIITDQYNLIYNLTKGKYYYSKKRSPLINILLEENFKESATINNVSFLLKTGGTYIVDGVATDDTTFLAYSQINLIKGNTYLLYGCPKQLYGNKFSMQIKYNDQIIGEDFGDSCIFTVNSTDEYITALLVFHVNIGTNISDKEFTPILSDLTAAYGSGSESSSFKKIIDDIWQEVIEGTTINEQGLETRVQLVLPENLNSSTTISGVKFELDLSGQYKTTGTSSEEINFVIYNDIKLVKDHEYVLSGCPLQPTQKKFSLQLKDDTTIIATDDGSKKEFTSTSDQVVKLNINIQNNIDMNDQIFIPSLIDLTETLNYCENRYTPKDNTVFWRKCGEYYIYYQDAWHQYTEPLFFTKLIQARSK